MAAQDANSSHLRDNAGCLPFRWLWGPSPEPEEASVSCWRLAEATSEAALPQHDCRQIISDLPGQPQCMNASVPHRSREAESLSCCLVLLAISRLEKLEPVDPVTGYAVPHCWWRRGSKNVNKANDFFFKKESSCPRHCSSIFIVDHLLSEKGRPF